VPAAGGTGFIGCTGCIGGIGGDRWRRHPHVVTANPHARPRPVSPPRIAARTAKAAPEKNLDEFGDLDVTRASVSISV
jgi:hypothetical protein